MDFFGPTFLPERQGHELTEYWRALLPQMEHTDELGGFQLLEIPAPRFRMNCSCMPTNFPWHTASKCAYLTWIAPWLNTWQRLGASFKIRRGTRKWLHRQVCQSYLPLRVLKRKKRGFAANVVDGWLRSSLNCELPKMLLDETSLMLVYLTLNPCEELLEGHQSGRQDNHKLLFSLVMIEQWLRGIKSNRMQSLSPHALSADCIAG